MRLVLDTNIVVSGLLWGGSPRTLLDHARAGRVSLFTSALLLAELDDVLSRAKLSERIQLAGVEHQDLVFGLAALCNIVAPTAIPSTILDDPDDDHVLACAVGAAAEMIVSGDRHLLRLGGYQGIAIRTAADVLARVASV